MHVNILKTNHDDWTAFTRTVVTRSISTLLRCVVHQFEAEDLSKLALPVTQIRTITVWCTFCMNQSYIICLPIWISNLVTSL